MNAKKEKEDIKDQGSQAKGDVKDSEKTPERTDVAKEKPLEKMTKPELLGKIGEFKEDSKKNYDLYLRSQAEMENIKKRNKKEKEEWIKYSNETLIKDILPVIDNLEKAMSHSNNENSLHALKEGVELTFKGFRDTLAKSGLEEIKAQGEPFDPCFHHAVSEQEDNNEKPSVILEELQKGYTFNQRLIRPAMVVVNKGKSGDGTDQDKTPAGGVEE